MPEPASALLQPFEAWWTESGQFCRAGGGDYEKTFAYRAYEAATERAAKLASDLAYDAAINYANGHAVDWDKALGEAIRGGDGGGR